MMGRKAGWGTRWDRAVCVCVCGGCSKLRPQMWSQEGDAVAQGCTVADAEPSARDQAFWGMERRRLKMTGAGQPCEGDMSGVVGGHWLRGSYFSFNSSAAKWLCGLGHVPCFCWIRGSIRSNPYIVNSTRWSSGTPGTLEGNPSTALGAPVSRLHNHSGWHLLPASFKSECPQTLLVVSGATAGSPVLCDIPTLLPKLEALNFPARFKSVLSPTFWQVNQGHHSESGKVRQGRGPPRGASPVSGGLYLIG